MDAVSMPRFRPGGGLRQLSGVLAALLLVVLLAFVVADVLGDPALPAETELVAPFRWGPGAPDTA